MAHETPTIVATRRERIGTRYAQRLRKTGRLPAVVYGHKTDPVAVSVDETALLGLVSHGVHVIEIDIEGGETETCLVKQLQFGYLGDNVIHVDFARVDLDEEVTVNVHLTFVGTSPAAQQAGAILKHDHSELAVTCRVAAIPGEIRVDMSKMEALSLTAQEIELPPALILADDPTRVIASITFLRAEEPEGEEVEIDEETGEPVVITEAKADGEEDKSEGKAGKSEGKAGKSEGKAGKSG